MYNFYGEILFIVVVITAIVYTIYFTFITHQKEKLKYLTPLYLIIFIVAISLVVNIIQYRHYEYDIHQVVFEDKLNLSIVKTEDRNYLYNKITNKEVTYINVYEKTPYKSNNLQPIYFKDIGDYYLVVYSPDNKRIIENERFLQGNYESNEIDHLVLIEKETGYIYDTQEYELIGLEIDLTSFQFGNNLIVFGVFIPYENNISFYQYINIQDEYSIEDAMSLHENYYSDNVGDWTHPSIHFHTLGDPSEITGFEISGRYLYYKDSYGRIYVGAYNNETYGVNFSFYETLMDEELAKEGYIKVTDTGIYYLSNDGHLYKTRGYSIRTLIEINVSKDEFESYIFE